MSELRAERDLLNRITELEQQFKLAHDARLEAERKLANVSLQHTSSFHAIAHQKVWGNSAYVQYLDKLPFESHESSAKEKRRRDPEQCRSNLLNRLCFGYNIAAFIKKPRIHQYIEDNKLYRSPEERQSSKFELFFDLVFVGAVHQMSDAAAESPTGLGLVKYILTFCPAFSIWSDVRDTMNQMGTDDVSQRLYILWIMSLLVGYSINASAVELAILGRPDDDISPDEVSEKTASRLALQYSMAFFCVAKLSRTFLGALYGYFIPRARFSLWASTSISALMCLLFFIAIFLPTRSLSALYVLVVLGISLEILLRLAGGIHLSLKSYFRKWDAKRSEGANAALREGGSETDVSNDANPIVRDASSDQEDRGNQKRRSRIYLAYNIEHHVERLGAFVTIVLGEMVANVFYTSTFATGINSEYGKAVLGLMIAFNMNWMYFDSGGGVNCIHAIRRHWFSGFSFTFLHLPLCAALLLASSSINRFVTGEEPEQGLSWFLGVGLGLSIMIMATLSLLHKVMEVPHESFHTTRLIILFTRYLAGLTMILLPLAHQRLNTLKYLGVYAGITVFLIIEEMVMRLEKAEDTET